LALLPPFVFARQHIVWAFPLWLIVGAVVYEIIVRIGPRRAT
jgi:hypothetical protein